MIFFLVTWPLWLSTHNQWYQHVCERLCLYDFICVYRVYRSLIPSVNRLLWTFASGWRKYLSGVTRCVATSYKSSPNSKKNEAHLKQMKLQEPPCQPGDRTIPWGNLHNTLAWRTQAAGSLRLWSKHPICWHLLMPINGHLPPVIWLLPSLQQVRRSTALCEGPQDSTGPAAGARKTHVLRSRNTSGDELENSLELAAAAATDLTTYWSNSVRPYALRGSPFPRPPVFACLTRLNAEFDAARRTTRLWFGPNCQHFFAFWNSRKVIYIYIYINYIYIYVCMYVHMYYILYILYYMVSYDIIHTIL